MGHIWYRAESFNKDCITSALEVGIDTFLCSPEVASEIRKLAKVKIAGSDGDLKLNEDYFEVNIDSKEKENEAAKLGKKKPVLIRTPDWEIIPIENLIANGAQIFWEVPNLDKAELAFDILETGVAGVVLATEDVAEIRKFSSLQNRAFRDIKLEECRILATENVGMADRVCVDTATYMKENQGMLAGNSSGGMLLVQSEASENPYVASRPFRVNLSAVHAYTFLPDGRTTYLSELKSGKKIVILNNAGKAESAVIGRIKMERRPMILVSFCKNSDQSDNPATYSLLLQNAETVRLFRSDKSIVSVANLKAGDVVLGSFDKIGRHFGMKVDESIQEK